MQIKYSEQSILDLEAIVAYISKDSIYRALSYADFLKIKIKLLATSPYMGAECKYKEVYQDCRVYIIDLYLVFYSVKDDNVIIRRVLNSAIDYTRNKI
jgi:plasmid stabilization system protein ParE